MPELFRIPLPAVLVVYHLYGLLQAPVFFCFYTTKRTNDCHFLNSHHELVKCG